MLTNFSMDKLIHDIHTSSLFSLKSENKSKRSLPASYDFLLLVIE